LSRFKKLNDTKKKPFLDSNTLSGTYGGDSNLPIIENLTDQSFHTNHNLFKQVATPKGSKSSKESLKNNQVTFQNLETMQFVTNGGSPLGHSKDRGASKSIKITDNNLINIH
jgi:hypothetical protein